MSNPPPTHPQPGGIVPTEDELNDIATTEYAAYRDYSSTCIPSRDAFVNGGMLVVDRLAPHIAAMEKEIQDLKNKNATLERDVENWKSVAHRNATNNK